MEDMDNIDQQIIAYKNKNAEFEYRYKQDFDSFTASLKNCANLEDEDEWMEWEVIILFLRKWQSIREKASVK